MIPAGSPIDGIRAITAFAAYPIAKRFGWKKTAAWAIRPAQNMVKAQPITAQWWLERRAQMGDFHYLALGDSTGQGIGASAPNRSYVGQLAERIELRLGEPIRMTNLCITGATSFYCARDQLPHAERVLLEAPDLVTIGVGANDIAAWDPVAYHRNLGTILEALPAHTIVGELPSFHLPWNERKVREANGILRSVAGARGLEVVPLHEATRSRGIPGILTEFAEDAFHPNDRGYEVWADAFWPYVEARVDEARAARQLVTGGSRAG